MHRAKNVFVGHDVGADDGDFCLEAIVLIGTQESGNVGANQYREHGIDIARNLGYESAIVRSVEGNPYFLDDGATGVLEGLLEPRHRLPTEGIVLAHGDDFFVAKFLESLIAKGLGNLAASPAHPDDVGAALPLCDVVGCNDWEKKRNLVGCGI